MSSEIKYRTITLTDRAPVRIREDEWPQIAHGWYSDDYAQCHLRVRQHPDGRAIVYGTYDYDPPVSYDDDRGFAAKAGVLLDGAHVTARIPQAVNDVAETLRSAADEAGHDFRAHISAAARECIAALPAVEL